MLSKSRIKEVRSLDSKKYRSASGLFIAEGKKLISELLDSEIKIEVLISTVQNLLLLRVEPFRIPEIIETSENEIIKASLLKNPQGCIALCRIPDHQMPANAAKENLVLCLEDIQDPGNVGTIVRLADWYGISDIICSPSTADIYNPKTVQATMGAICRVHVHYLSLQPILQNHIKSGEPVYGTLLKGENIYKATLSSNGIIVLGNEGNGISNNLLSFISHKITIPDFQTGIRKADSLNVSVAAAIIISEFRRRTV
jgi:RNA methyltransferase, TrmH family